MKRIRRAAEYRSPKIQIQEMKCHILALFFPCLFAFP